jgi:hypothetical protein
VAVLLRANLPEEMAIRIVKKVWANAVSALGNG